MSGYDAIRRPHAGRVAFGDRDSLRSSLASAPQSRGSFGLDGSVFAPALGLHLHVGMRAGKLARVGIAGSRTNLLIRRVPQDVAIFTSSVSI